MVAEHQVLMKVWREACQHIEIQKSAAGIAEHLSAHLPLDRIEVFRIEPEHRLVAKVAVTPVSKSNRSSSSQELHSNELKRLLAWIRRGVLAMPESNGQFALPLSTISLSVDSEDVRIAPLKHGVDTHGMLALFASSGHRFGQDHEEVIRALIEPFSAALANDRRLHELAALREAAEADRRSLLRRLGRTDITDEIVGAEGGLSQVMKRIELVSQSDAPVLLLGETGTGKEVIARAVHERSDRYQGPFIRVNCGAIPSELIDSQLFGHEKGAFTGASEKRKGWFERADGGTLLLDEIGELPPNAQVRFLRVLQDSFIERVGGGDPLRVDVRVVAATHRDLAAMVQQGTFREDLWYRIAVFPILLPPLRDRLGDIAVLAEHFAKRAANRFGLTSVPPSNSDIELLRGYNWPGNIRELGSVIDRAAILGEGRTLQIEAALGFSAPAKAVKSVSQSPSDFRSLMSLDDAMREHIKQTLQHTKGRIEGTDGAAMLLQINPHTLRARMRKLGIDWTCYR